MSEQLIGVPIQVTTRGGVPQGAGGYALKRIEHLLSKTPGHVLHVAVTLTMDHNPANTRPARAEIALDVNGTPLRVHVAAATPGEAADLAVGRLQRRLVHLR
ncbi:MAG: HPF/RaiA family ribosome-associated protein, partial [Nocardioidaceae bacterium]